MGASCEKCGRTATGLKWDVSSGDDITVTFTLLDYVLNFDRSMVVVSHLPAAHRWHPRFDTLINFGAVGLSADAVLRVTCSTRAVPIALYVIPMTGAQTGDQPKEFLMSDVDGRIKGRVAFHIRWLGLDARNAEANLEAEWQPQRMKAMSAAYGKEIGRSVARTLQDLA